MSTPNGNRVTLHKMSTTIQIALASDENCFHGLLVTLASIIQHCSKDCPLTFHVLDGGIKNDSYKTLNRVASQANRIAPIVIYRHKISPSLFSSFPSLQGNYMTYARFLLPELMPEDDFIIYSDCDMLWQMNVADMWKLRDKQYGITASLDMDASTREKERQWFTAHNISIDENRYFCAGLAILNLNYFRENNIVSKCATFLQAHHDALYNDQTALNAVIPANDKGLLPRGMQVFSLGITAKDFESPFVLHYAGDAPWRKKYASDLLSDVSMIWFRYYASVKHISTWEALREFLPAHQIILKRGIAECITSTRQTRFFTINILAHLLKPGLSEYLDKRLRKLNIHREF